MVSKEAAPQNVIISVILPVFNVEGYIEACISSLKAQTFRELEFIFVDDCGTDSSMNAVEEFARGDNRVRIIHNMKNLGPGPSRNKGIELARGEYLSFADPDDWLAPDFYELLYNKAFTRKADIVKGIRAGRFPDRDYTANSIRGKLSTALNNRIRKSRRRRIPLFCVFTSEHQSAIYKRSLFDDPIVRYGTSKNAEDTTFLLRATLNSPSIELEENAIYYYRQRDNSATAFYSKTRAFEELFSFKEKMNAFSDIRHVLPCPDNYSQYYLINTLSEYYANACFSRKQCDWIAEEERRYIELFEEEMLRLDMMFSQKDYLKQRAELMAMREYNVWISPTIRMPGSFHSERVQAWTDLLIRYPDAKQCYISGCSNAIVYSVLDHVRDKLFHSGQLSGGINSHNGDRCNKTPLIFAWEKLDQLGSDQKRRVIRTMPGSFFMFLNRKIRYLLFGFAY